MKPKIKIIFKSWQEAAAFEIIDRISDRRNPPPTLEDITIIIDSHWRAWPEGKITKE